MPQRKNVHYSIGTFVVYTYDLDLSPLTLKTFSAISIHLMNICGKFHCNLFIKQRDITLCKISINGQRADGRTA